MKHQELPPGFAALHGDLLEDLALAIQAWLQKYPLDPLEDEIFLVQSNGIAEWLQGNLAQREGICTATRMLLPGQFLWDCYHRVLGETKVPLHSPWERNTLRWRLLRLLPSLIQDSQFSTLATYTQQSGQSALGYWELAKLLADVLDQYQVYRADWLDLWSRGRNLLLDARGNTSPLPEEQQWQPLLWQILVRDVASQGYSVLPGRNQIHQAFLDRLKCGDKPATPLPRRVVLFGAAAIPAQTLEALHLLGKHMQVLAAIPNPCRHHWTDIISGDEILQRYPRMRNPSMDSDSPPVLDPFGPPLLAAWGRQGRDFMNLLDQYEETQQHRLEGDFSRINLFSEDPGFTLLRQLQVQIRDLDTSPVVALEEDDRSLMFHECHGPLREIEILQDELLVRLADGKLQPRDIIVMVPDIRPFAPLVRAVFDRYPREDPRYIPYHIVDLQAEDQSALLRAVEWLFHLPQSRCRQNEIRTFLDCPAVQQRIGVEPEQLPRIFLWMEASGWRWGLSADHRNDLEFGACGDQNTGHFALQRLMLGYASGPNSHFSGIEALGEPGGLEAELLGALWDLHEKLEYWRKRLGDPQPPDIWAKQARQMLGDFFAASDGGDLAMLESLESALARWQEECHLAGLNISLPLAVFRDAWLPAVNGDGLRGRFLGGGVTFSTLLPMRAIPYQMVCLLGMNDGDYPRTGYRQDFDLMTLSGMGRAGDRSRRDDDRYLMLEALLSARQALHVSWTGRDPRSHQTLLPSLLVSQLRDWLRQCWGDAALMARTILHPMHPYSSRYLEDRRLVTYAREWFPETVEESAPAVSLPPPAGTWPLTVRDLAQIFLDPVGAFYGQRLQARPPRRENSPSDGEAFTLQPLEKYRILESLLEQMDGMDNHFFLDQMEKEERSGFLPLGTAGKMARKDLQEGLRGPWKIWMEHCLPMAPADGNRSHVILEKEFLRMETLLPDLRKRGSREWVLCRFSAGRLGTSLRQIRPGKLVLWWIEQLLAAHAGKPAEGIFVGLDSWIIAPPPEPAPAGTIIQELMDLGVAVYQTALPVTLEIALEYLETPDQWPLLLQKHYADGHYRRGKLAGHSFFLRHYPEPGDLESAAPPPRNMDLRQLARRYYQPFHSWLETLEVRPYPAENTGFPK